MNTSRQASGNADGDQLRAVLRHNVRLDRISYLPITQLKRHSRKLRKRSREALQALQASVSSFGLVVPILIDGTMTIIGGEGIVDAAAELGYEQVPTILIDHLDENEVRLLRIALNRLSEQSHWDTVELGFELGELMSLDIELGCEVTGFSTIEIDNLVHPATPASEDDPDDELGFVGQGEPVSRVGDMWLCDEHRVACGSSLEESVIEKVMGDDVAQMVCSDAPYNVKISGHVSSTGKHREFAQASGEMSEAEFTEFLTTSVRVMSAAVADGGLIYLYMDWRHMWEMLAAIRASELTMINLAVWVKSNPGLGSFLRSQHELVFIARKGKAPHRNNVQLGRFGRNRSNCWMYPGVNSFGGDREKQLDVHPTPKNVVQVADAIRDATHRGEVVLDGFLGSGTTLIAAERTGRICRGVELDPIYVDAIVHRWEKATGRKATLHGTGETFEDVRARRALLTEPAATEERSPEIVARPRTRAAA